MTVTSDSLYMNSPFINLIHLDLDFWTWDMDSGLSTKNNEEENKINLKSKIRKMNIL